jgi:subtilisin family serine protease
MNEEGTNRPGMYRVFGCDGGAGTDVILAAMLMAAANGADVISMSLGYMDADENDDPFSDVTSALNEQGVAVIVAAGNGMCTSV